MTKGTDPYDDSTSNHNLLGPVESGWECWMFGSSPESGGICWKPTKGNVPNWFHRWMQKLLIGNRWRRSSK